MRFKAVLLVSVLCAIVQLLAGEKSAKIVGRIYGGEYSTSVEFPWLVAISRNGYHWCSGSILTPRAVLTTASCIYGLNTAELAVRVGSKFKYSGGELILVRTAMYHANYDSKTQEHDVAVIRLRWDITLSDKAAPIGLHQEWRGQPSVEEATVVGWGATEDGHPEKWRYAAVKIFKQEDCTEIYERSGHKYSNQMLCAGKLGTGVDHCGGDAGSPLVAQGMVIGLASFQASPACGPKAHEVAVYVRISRFVDWVKAYLAGFGERLE